MTNSRLTNEALRLMADQRVRLAGFMFWAMVLLSIATVWRASAADTAFAWFASGIIVGATIAAFGNLISIASHARQMRESQDQARQAATLVADFVNDELDRRGKDYEALLEPNGLITIHRRDVREHRSRMH